MSELKISYCIKCGASGAGYLAELGGGRYKCKYCGSEYREESAAKDIEHILSVMGWTVEAAVQRGLYAAKEEKIANCRSQLYKAVHDEYLSDKEILKWADKIKEENAGDFLAEFYSVAVRKNVKEVNAFLDGIDPKEKEDYVEDVIEFMLRVADYGNILSVEHLIDEGIHDERQTAYLNRVHELAGNLKSGLYDTEVPRDAFIAYSSKDFSEVNRIVTELEAQGLGCFVAMRNLRHGKGARENYVKELQKAMNCCKCFVFISSRNSRSPDCDAIKLEIPYIRDFCKEKPRIEYVLDTVKTGNVAELKVKDFFDGLEYCRDVTDLARRICLAMERGGMEARASLSPKKYCVYCLAENEEDASFCKQCGKSSFAEKLAEATAIYKQRLEEEAKNGRSADAPSDGEGKESMGAALKKKFREWNQIITEKAKKTIESKRPGEESSAMPEEEAGDPEGIAFALCEKAKDHYYGRQGVAISYEKAAELFRTAAVQGSAEAQRRLGACYELGRGVERSAERAAGWYKKAAEQGDADAQYRFGQFLYRGVGVEKSHEEGLEWYKKAAAGGHTHAQFTVGRYYELREDLKEAAEWYKQAAANGHTLSAKYMKSSRFAKYR